MGLERVKVKNLMHQHSEYQRNLAAYQQLADMEEGSVAILARKEFYLPKKVGEETDEYENRLAKLAYTPHLANTIRETIAKITSAPLHVEKADSDYWAWVRKHLDGEQQNEDDLLKEIFSKLLYYGRVITVVDRAPLLQPPTSLAEDIQMRQAGAYPTVEVLSPLAVTDWGESSFGKWYTVTTFEEVYEPLADPVTIATWKLYTPEDVWTYTAKVQVKGGLIKSVWVPDRSEDGGQWKSVNDPEVWLDGTVITHGLGLNPLAVTCLPPEMWVGGLCYLKQVQHLRIESQLTEAACIAGTVVRLFTPPAPVERSPKLLLEAAPQPVKADMSHTIVGANYQFVESAGTAISNLLQVMQKIEDYIQSVASLDFKQSMGQQQAADSKQIDTSLLEDVMKLLGAKGKFVYQSILERFAAWDGQPSPTVEGLENYGTDTLDQMLTQSQEIEMLVGVNRVPMVALKMWYSRLASLIAGNVYGSVEKELLSQLEELFQEQPEADPMAGMDKVKQLMDQYGLSVEEASFVMNGGNGGPGQPGISQ